MDTVVEFGAYGTRMQVVHDLVNSDVQAEHFFTFGRIDHVSYFDTIEGFLRAYSDDTVDRSHVCITTIRLFDRETKTIVSGTHSIIIYFGTKTGPLYIYDPNGTYDTKSIYIYLIDRMRLPRQIASKRTMYSTGFSTMDIFRKWLEEYTTASVIAPSTPGIQSVMYTTPISSYISNYGYCMFYNYLVISFIISQREKSENHYTIFKQITGSTSGLIIPIPASHTDAQNGTAPDGTMERWTVDTVDQVFPIAMIDQRD